MGSGRSEKFEIIVNKSLHLSKNCMEHCKRINRYLISTTDVEMLDDEEVEALEIESFAEGRGQINSIKPRF